MATRQELLDRVVAHCNTQGHQSVSEDGEDGDNCLYHAPDGSKCAIGALIPDEMYNRLWDVQPLNARLLPADVLTACGFDLSRDSEMIFIDDLQGLHDDQDNWADGRLTDAAVVYVRRQWGI